MDAELLTRAKRVHLLGIGGVGVSATAKLLKDMGYEVSGSDEGAHPPTTTYLEDQNIPFKQPYSPENIPPDTDIAVVGMNKKLRKETNKEVAKMVEMGIPIVSFPQILEVLTKETHNIICAGSYGKSTCAAITSFCLEDAGLSPSFFIGALPYGLEESSRKGKGDLFVLEGDEYPTAHDDQAAKFLHYNPTDVLITAMTHDHLNIFPTQEAFNKPFVELAKKLKSSATAVVNNDGPETKAFADAFSGTCTTYALQGKADWTAENITLGKKTTFTLVHKNEPITEIETLLIGRHNVENITGVAALLIGAGHLTPEQFAQGIKKFRGVRRRLDTLTNNTKIPLYEGFGSSYEKARAAIAAVKRQGEGRLIVLFEPHAISWKMPAYREKYKTVFEGADKVILYTKPLQGGEDTLKAEDILPLIPQQVTAVHTPEEGIATIEHDMAEGDTILSLSSGNFDGMTKKLAERLDAQFKTHSV